MWQIVTILMERPALIQVLLEAAYKMGILPSYLVSFGLYILQFIRPFLVF